MKKNALNPCLSAAIAGLLAGGSLMSHAAAASARSGDPAARAHNDENALDLSTKDAGKSAKDTHVCKGQNSCKGKGGCGAGDNGCAGKNSCKGKGGCAAAAAKHSCKGQNSCKGKGGCGAGDNGCAGKNSCKGKGGCAVPVKEAKK